MQCTGGSPATKRERSQWPHLCAVGRQILTGRQVQLAERGGFEPPIGLHLCRISSAVQSTTLPPLQAQIRANQALRSGRVLERFHAKWKPVRVKKTRQNKRGEPCSDSIRTDRLDTRNPGQTRRAGLKILSQGSGGKKGGTARRGKNRRSRVASLKLRAGSAASLASLSDEETVTTRAQAATRSRF